ncbi:MAG TPA: AMP-binding protein [Candidatus Limnocylindria bacterium]|nr:AMP-binding protein [Candidatus Limnocylindria bacterium]
MVAFETDLDGARARDWTARGLWRDETVERYLDRWATHRPERTAMVDGAGRCTWAGLARTVERVAHGLAAHGVAPGRVIACQLPNWNEFVVVLLAAARLGAVVNPIPPIYRASELRFMLKRLEACAVVIPGVFRGFDHVAMLAALRPEVPGVKHVFVARGTPGPGMEPFGVLTDTAWEAREGRGGLPGTDPNAVHEVIFTSGTTGEPKGVMHTPNTVLASVFPVIERLDLSERDVVLMASTFAHQTGYLYGVCATLVLGATGVWLDVWNAEAAARLVERERVTFTMGATPFLRDLTCVPGRHDFSSLRVFISAGAPIPRPLVADARARLGCTISPGWGMTENGLVSCVGPQDPDAKVLATDGSPVRGMELSIVGAEGRPAPPDAEGDLLVRGAAQFVGYFKRPDFTRDSHTADGWFHTGDRGRIDADGYLSITGRTKDLIIRGGENIPVAEVESVLFTHPKVAGVAVVGMPDARLGERACAFVVPKGGQTPTLAELVTWLDAHQLARQKFPERLELVDEFPMTPSGKIQKYRLRDVLAERLAREAGAAR